MRRQPKIERAIASERKKEINAFRLTQRVRLNHRYCNVYYNVTITPKGKNKTHDTLLLEVRQAINGYKVVLDVFLIAESDNTNHYHGVIVCKDSCQFLKLFSKKNAFHFNIKTMPLNDWCTYCVKRDPTKVFLKKETIYFNKPFLTDIQLAHYEP